MSYAYDNIGNITAKTIGSFTSAYSYNNPSGRPHAVKTLIGQLGNGYSFNTREIDYNAESMPVSIVDLLEDGITYNATLFKYDGNNARVKKDSEDGVTYYIGNHYEVKNGQGVKYIFGNNIRIAQVKGSVKHFFHKDHLFSSTVMSNANGAKVESTDYMPYGKTRSHTGQNLSDYKFTDQELDKSTEFYNYDARLYDPLIGRFTTPDPVIPNFADMEDRDTFDPQMLNRYSYCKNNPIIYIDPSGLDWFDFGWDTTDIQWRWSSEPQLKPGIFNWAKSMFGYGEYATSLGPDVLVVTGKKENEQVGDAMFEIYSHESTDGPIARETGNTIPSDTTKYRTMAEGLYTDTILIGSYNNSGIEALWLAEGTVRSTQGEMMSGVLAHRGNHYFCGMFDTKGKPWSTGCLTFGTGVNNYSDAKKFGSHFVEGMHIYLRRF